MWSNLGVILLMLSLPTVAAFGIVLFVNYCIPIRGRFDHALAAAIITALVWGGWDLVTGTTGYPFIQAAAGLILMFIADLVGTFISFTNRLRNAVVTAIVSALVYFGAIYVLVFVIGLHRGWH